MTESVVLGRHKMDLFGIYDMTAEEILNVLTTVKTMKYILGQPTKTAPHLQGKTVVMLFYETSARGKLSFEMAARHLSANVIDMTNSLLSKDISELQDTGELVDQMGADFIILRHPMAGAPNLLAKNVKASVINAGDGFNENPGQSLLDMLTIQEQKKDFEGLKVAVIGDIAHSRVSKSNIWALGKLGAEIRASGPSTLLPYEIEKMGVEVFYDAREAVNNADVVLTSRVHTDSQNKDLIPSMAEYKNFFRIDEALMRYAKKDAIVMHPGPVRRGIEISAEVMKSPQCIVNDQVSNSVAVRMAMLYSLSQLGGVTW
ncbi:MAG: aspartate carbamoyltransferase catalytic subunit [Bacillota bacterium]